MFKRKSIIKSQVSKSFFSIKNKFVLNKTKKRLEAKEKANENIRENDLIYESSNLHANKCPITTKAKTETSGIYVYIGTYQINNSKNNDNPNDFLVSFDSSLADYREYIKIEEPNRIKKIVISLQEEFERENIVLYPPQGKDKNIYFNEVREMYLTTLNEYGQEKAIEKILDFQTESLRPALSLEELIKHINKEDDEDFEVELHLQR